MINVNGLKRNAKNIVKKYSDVQIKVREATSNDPWGPSSTLMSEIADLTYNVVAFSEIMQMIWKRLNDSGKNWRHVYKALVLLEYLIKTGTEKVARQCMENIFAIQTLKDFQYMDENKDYGKNIREKSKKIVDFLKDSEQLKIERTRALKAKSRLAESVSSIGAQGSVMTAGDPQSSGLNPDGPQTATEEEDQLKLALALSIQEAEQQEVTRKNDELRLKLAIDVSKKANSSNLIDDQPIEQPSTSGAIADLLGLSIPPISPEQSTATATTATPTTSTARTTTTITNDMNLFSSLTRSAPEPQNDPWSVDPWTINNIVASHPPPIADKARPMSSKNPFHD